MKYLILCSACVVMACQPESPQRNSEVISHHVLYEDADVYAAWPAIVRASNGDLLVAFTATEEHLSPDGKIVTIRSSDNGATWSSPQEIYNSLIDDRESGLTHLRDGRILAHIWSTHWTRALYERHYTDPQANDKVQRWIRHVDSPSYLGATEQHGSWLLISEDDGHTWSQARKGPDTIHGGIHTQDGSLLVASYRRQKNHVGVYSAPHPDSSWTLISTVHSPMPDSIRFGEPHVVQLRSGRILMMIRPTSIPYNDRDPRLYLWQSWSDDQGKTWAEPEETPLWGFPPHLLQLQDGRVVVTYGHRRPPYGQRAAISPDGISWHTGDIITLRDDAPNHDLGYPVSVELAPDTVLTVYYQKQPHGKVDILGTTWSAWQR